MIGVVLFVLGCISLPIFNSLSEKYETYVKRREIHEYMK